jgi:two-component system response regulator AtoC
MARILVADDEEGVRSFLAEALEYEGHAVTTAADGEEAARLLAKQGVDLLLTDLKMPKLDGLSLLRKVREEQPDVEVIVLTAVGSVESAVAAMKAGAFEYLTKPVSSPAELRLTVARALERRSLLNWKAETKHTAGEVVLSWGAPAMNPVVEALRKVAPTHATVLLMGESGTGKEVAARALHQQSERADGPFVAVNCAALTETLLESELFGHEKGAFTGAVAQRRGRIELAQGGTFFLDEVGELKAELQAKLLRVLQERRFERVGGTRTLEADVRWVAATNRDLKAMMARGEFREDLYHRLAVFPIRLPPLRERREDLRPLAELLLRRIGEELGRPGLRLSAEAAERLVAFPWPGNVRELRNALERAAILADGPVVEARHLWLEDPTGAAGTPPAGAAPVAAPGDGARVPDTTLEALERMAIEQAIALEGGNRKRAAQRLGIGLRTLYDKLRRYGMQE